MDHTLQQIITQMVAYAQQIVTLEQERARDTQRIAELEQQVAELVASLAEATEYPDPERNGPEDETEEGEGGDR